ncbi:MAG: hypothetical protein IH888_04245 [Planctomycetes bacterium]|nr:hypothetical protein [Planctomycetota bacterium]
MRLHHLYDPGLFVRRRRTAYTAKHERNIAVVARRAEGRTLEQVGRDFGISRERVRQIVKKAHQS